MKKINPLMILAIILCLVLSASVLHLLKTNQFDNIYPEIFGFCLDGIVFVFILGVLQDRQTRKEEIKAKTTLKETLGHFIRDFVWWMSVGAVQDMEKLTITKADKKYMVTVLNQAKEALKALSEGKQIPPGLIDPVKRYGQKESIMLKCMLPIAAQVNEDHLKGWFNVIRGLDGVIEANNEKDLHLSSVHFLKQVVGFMELP